ncbi:MAG TPA: prepilin-type N-terminal cleavage/methylation domain-containing protein [Isosphaeraceae bacterium]|nr:prepilin-type N-terminal cleavage/methylation domain-containing protein [Isosphaeraceae bacterium]
MNRSLRDDARFATRRRGVTLVEMLVTLAVLLLMMTVIVQIFQAATGALSSAQSYQELDNQLRQLDATIRSDLNGVTCKLTPPNNPQNNPGYLEYGENEFADIQGEDADDYIRFTAKAPAGRPFTGRMWVPPPNSVNLPAAAATQLFEASYQPITITSDYAEIIYFLRNGNLYRRVLLVAPERQSVVVPTINNQASFMSLTGLVTNQQFLPYGLGGATAVSWQGMNDLSAHPEPTGPDPTTGALNHNSVILNTLADLTNRENRWAYQRFANDFQTNLTGLTPQDNLADDFNGDNVPDYYPSLYGGLFGTPTNQLDFEPLTFTAPWVPAFRSLMAFPYVFPGAYSCPQVLSAGNAPYGWIHSPNPQVYIAANNSNVAFDSNNPPNATTLVYLNSINHNPIDVGDNLPLPGGLLLDVGTWWGFPTWRETLSAGWADPTVQLNLNQAQPIGLTQRSTFTPLPVADDHDLLPPMQRPNSYSADFSFIRRKPDPYSDGRGAISNFWSGTAVAIDPLWSVSWEDDLIMTGVRSFDIKAYDNSKSDYVDLAWGDDLRLYQPYVGLPGAVIPALPPGLGSTPPLTVWPPVNPAVNPVGQSYGTLAQTFAHEGRMPPLVADLRVDAQFGAVPANTYPVPPIPTNPNYANYTGNIGDDQAGIVRLRRIWDSWSTEYSQAPGTGVYNNKSNPADPFNGFPWGPPYTPPIYPSYPPPYPAPLRGIQIQIRVTDPTNQRVKTLTIRQEFTDKL